MIPPFDANGSFPSGIHWATWEEIQTKFAFSAHRVLLLEGLSAGLKALKQAGCQTAYLNGSFTSTKEIPKDFDVCYDTRGVNGNTLDSVFFDFRQRRAAQKKKYLGEFFPSHTVATLNPYLSYLEFFQRSKDSGEAKGIIGIDLRRFP